MSEVLLLPHERARDVVSVLCEAFADYPVMRFILGEEGDYARRLDALIGFFTAARVHRGETLLGVAGEVELVAAALVSDPTREAPPSFDAVRDETWAALGAATHERYAAYGEATSTFDVAVPHIHLNMIGVRRAGRGLGLGRLLLEHVHDLSRDDPRSEGVSLTTEDPENVPLYEHFGYEVIGYARVSPELETWGFFRPDDA